MLCRALIRLGSTALVLFGVCTITFLLLRFTPGDPAEMMLREHGTATDAAHLRKEMGLDRPFRDQYFIFLRKLAHGDLGESYLSHQPVTKEIGSHLPSTFALAFTAMFFALITGVPLGILAAFYRGKWIDHFLTGFSLFGLSLPSFWLAPVLIIIFSIKLDWLPVSGQDDGTLSIILPAASLGLSLSAVLLRITRAALFETLGEDFITVARAKGLQEKFVFSKHALKAALSPIITVTGLQFGAILTGVVITETIFDWPGIGILLYSALRSRNYPVVQGCVLTISAIYVIVNLCTDLTYQVFDPRISE